jgi:AcrR family transcriptional regulator/DNA-binding MarR family transcriptional regulator
MGTRGRAPSELTAPEIREENGFKHERVTEIQRARMLAAMAELVAERGAASVTVAHVVARSGVSRRTFYEVFSDREDCFLAAFDEAIHQLASVVLPAYDGPSRWREKIRAGLAELLERLDRERSTGRLVIVETLGAGPRALERRRRVLAEIIAAVDLGRGEAKRGEGPPPLTAEGIVGAVLSVIHTRLGSCSPPAITGSGTVDDESAPLVELTSQLMSMIVLPYLGAPAARRELERPVPKTARYGPRAQSNPLKELDMRLTYRTVRVLAAIAETPGSSNRGIATAAGISDQGQMSKLLARLHHLGLIHNTGAGQTRGEPNAWTLTDTGRQVQGAIAGQTTRG